MMGKILLSLLGAGLITLSFPPFEIPTLSIIGFAIYFFLISSYLKDRNTEEEFVLATEEPKKDEKEKNKIWSSQFIRGTGLSFIMGLFLGYMFFYWLYYPLYVFYNSNKFEAYLTPIFVAIIFSLYHFVLFFVILFIIHKAIGDKFKTLLIAPFIWTFLELLREFIIFNGFPWNYIGYSISYVNIIAQVTSLFGIYSLTFFIILVAVLLSWVFIYYKEPFKIGSTHLISAILTLLLFGFIVGYGFERLKNFKVEGIEKKVAIIQGNIEQERKLSVEGHKSINREYINLINQVLKANEKVDLIILPESAIYILPSYIDETYINFFSRIQDKDALILTGVDDVIIADDGDIKVYNSIVLFKGNGENLGMYRKIKLVPFGEYTPKPFGIFKGLFPYLGGIDFSPGKEKKILKYGDFKIVPLICFESIFPYLVAEFAKKGNLIVNVTNDAWFGDTAAPFQHFEMARVRAIENGKYVVRVANTGISAVIDPLGHITAILPMNKQEIGIAKVVLIDKQTFFEKFLIPIYAFYIFSPLTVFMAFFFYNEGKKSASGKREKDFKEEKTKSKKDNKK